MYLTQESSAELRVCVYPGHMVTWEQIWIDPLLTAGIWVRAADLDPERSVLKTGTNHLHHSVIIMFQEA